MYFHLTFAFIAGAQSLIYVRDKAWQIAKLLQIRATRPAIMQSDYKVI